MGALVRTAGKPIPQGDPCCPRRCSSNKAFINGLVHKNPAACAAVLPRVEEKTPVGGLPVGGGGGGGGGGVCVVGGWGWVCVWVPRGASQPRSAGRTSISFILSRIVGILAQTQIGLCLRARLCAPVVKPVQGNLGRAGPRKKYREAQVKPLNALALPFSVRSRLAGVNRR